MAYIEKRGKNWRARIERVGYRVISKTFRTKALAEAWARDIEATMDKGGVVSGRHQGTVADLFNRFSEEVCPSRKGKRWEQVRIKKLLREDWTLKRATELLPEDIQRWRDRSLKRISGSSVSREMKLCSSIYNYAIKEWRLPLQVNPFKMVIKPKENPHRTRTYRQEETDALLAALGYSKGMVLRLASHYTAMAMLLALATSMRIGEICALRVADANIEERYLLVRDSKNGTARYIPLTKDAIELVKHLIKGRKETELLTKYTKGTISLRFREARNTLGLTDLHFHDTRHTATTQIAKKLSNVLELAAVTGHKDLRSLQVYYNPVPGDLADKMDG